MFVVIISEKGGAERRENFDRVSVTVGRVQGNDLMLPKGNVSKRHCTLAFEAGRFVVADHNSTNGTYVNRRRIAQPTVVREGDRIYVGDFVLRLEAFRADAAPQSDGDIQELDAASLGEPLRSEPTRGIPTRPSDPPGAEAHEALADSVREPHSHQTPPPKPPLSTLHDAHDVPSRELLEAVAQLIARVQSKLEPRLLDRPMDEATEKRVERVVGDAVEQLVTEGVLDDELDQGLVVRLALAELLHLGPLTSLLADEAISEVVFSGALAGSMVRAGVRMALSVPLCVKESAERIARRLCRAEGQELGKAVGAHSLWLAGREVELGLLRTGIPSQGSVLRLARALPPARGLPDCIRLGMLSGPMAEFLRLAVVTRHNVLVVGEDRLSVEPLLSALVASSRDQVVILGSPLAASGFPGALVVPPEELAAAERSASFDSILSLPAHRVVVPRLGGAAGAELTTELVGAGLSGVHCGLYARSAEDGMSQYAAQLAIHTRLPPAAALQILGGAFDLVVEVTRLRDAQLRVTRLAEVNASDGTLATVFEFVPEPASSDAVGGAFRASGDAPRFAARLRQQGHVFDASVLADTHNSIS